jgi:hypothetical protein
MARMSEDRSRCIIGESVRLDQPPRCGSELAHQGCRFAKGRLDCSADAKTYDACPYHQQGSTVRVYP